MKLRRGMGLSRTGSLLILGHLIACCSTGYGGYCSGNFGTAVYEQGYRCLIDIIEDPVLEENQKYALLQGEPYWKKYCRYWHQTKQCLVKYFPDCSHDYRTRVFHAAMGTSLGFYQGHVMGGVNDVTTPDEICNNESLTSDISARLKLRSVQECRRNTSTDAVEACYNGFFNEVTQVQSLVDETELPNSLITSMKRWVVVTFRCILGALPMFCSDDARDFVLFLANLTIPESVQVTTEEIYIPTEIPSNFGAERSTVGVFGDPHIKGFGIGPLQTCAATGKALYLHNKYLSVWGTNTGVGGRATALTEITIEFLKEDGTLLGAYIAENAELPSMFPGEEIILIEESLPGNTSVVMVEYTPDQKLVMFDQRSGAVFMLRKWRSYYFFTLRMADVLFRQSYGLLLSGCSTGEKIDVTEETRYRKRRKRTALFIACQDACANVTSHREADFKSLCLFDCLTMKDPLVSQMSKDTLDDMDSILSTDQLLTDLFITKSERTDQMPVQGTSSGAPCRTVRQFLVTALFILWIVR